MSIEKANRYTREKFAGIIDQFKPSTLFHWFVFQEGGAFAMGGIHGPFPQKSPSEVPGYINYIGISNFTNY